MKGNKIQLQSSLAAIFNKRRYNLPVMIRTSGTAYFGRWKCFQYWLYSHLVIFNIICRIFYQIRAASEFTDIGFIPDLPIGDDRLIYGISLYKLINYFLPLLDMVW